MDVEHRTSTKTTHDACQEFCAGAEVTNIFTETEIKRKNSASVQKVITGIIVIVIHGGGKPSTDMQIQETMKTGR